MEISENCVSVQVHGIPGVSRNFLRRKSITHQLSNHVSELVSFEIRRTIRCSLLPALKILCDLKSQTFTKYIVHVS